jgi:biopolymer transport protein ExbB/TolQ
MFRNVKSSVALFGALFVILTIIGLALGAQNTANTSTQQQGQEQNVATPSDSGVPDSISQASPKKAEAQQSGIARNFTELTRQGGPVMYPIYGVFILGLGVVVYQFVRVFFDNWNAKPIKSNIESKLSEHAAATDPKLAVNEIWEIVREYPKSHLAKLLDKLCDLWQRDPSADVLQVEIKGYLDTVKERYEIGRGFATLLSDTAGALGLLGTVLGMYQTFMPGRLEASQIISGMGVALVTTIGGLIVSIILNFAISWAHSTFHSHLEWVEERGDKFRNRFGIGQATVAVAPGAAVAAPAVTPAQTPMSVITPVLPETKVTPPRRVPTTLKILSGNHQTAEAGAVLPKALEVAVEDQYGKPMENFPVIFETNGTARRELADTLITFDNGDTVKKVETDFLGRAKVQARLGKSVGPHKILARVNGEANLVEAFDVEGRPGAPDKLHVLSGHLQTGQPGALLAEPFSLKLEDSCGNPVPDQAVVFEVVYNHGRLDSDKSRVEIRTDEDGVATIDFRLAETAGANIVKAVVKSKTTRKLETSFESMGKE